MAYLNKALLIGALGDDPKTNKTKAGKAVTNFSVATNKDYTSKDGEKKKITVWHNVTAYDGLGETAAKYLKKGSSVYVEGEMQVDSWEADDGNKRYKNYIKAERIQFLDPSGKKVVKNHAPGGEDRVIDDAPGIDSGEEIPF